MNDGHEQSPSACYLLSAVSLRPQSTALAARPLTDYFDESLS
jgi:hypothetical protein